MGINGRREKTTKARGRPHDGFLRFLRAVALTAVLAGAVGSVGLMLWIGHRNPSRLLLVLFAGWVLSPFMALLLAHMASKRWSFITRATLYGEMLILALGSLAFYADVVWRPRPQPAFVFLVVPAGSWLLITIVVPIAALISGRLSRPGTGA